MTSGQVLLCSRNERLAAEEDKLGILLAVCPASIAVVTLVIDIELVLGLVGVTALGPKNPFGGLVPLVPKVELPVYDPFA